MSWRNRCGLLLFAFVVTVATMPNSLFAHPLAPSSLRLRDLGDGRYEVRWVLG